MRKVLIICAAGMSSSLIAKKTSDYFLEKGIEITLEATHASQGAETIKKDQFDLYLCSPQTRMYYNKLKIAADEMSKPLENIPPQAYVPIPTAIEKLAKLITETLGA